MKELCKTSIRTLFRSLSDKGGWLAQRCVLSALLLAPGISASTPNDLPSLGDSSSRIVSPQMEQQIGEIFLKQLQIARSW